MTMPTFFQQQSASLHQRLKACLEEFEILDYAYLISGDVSGIQDFIFSVKSEKASKSLKGRSFFVQALTRLGIHLLQRELGKAQTHVFYDGGGNFYLLSKVPVDEAVEKVRDCIDEDCKEREIYLSLSALAIGQMKFSEVWKEIHRLSNEAKLRKFSTDALSFLPYAGPEMEEDQDGDKFEKGARYDNLTEQGLKNFSRKVRFEAAEQPHVDGRNVAFFKAKMVLGTGDETMQDWVDGLPRWSESLLKQYDWLIQKRQEEKACNSKIKVPEQGNIIEFADLAAFARARTGTDKLAVLKMDVDNLGTLFGRLQDWPGAKQASAAMSWFFGAFMSDLLSESFEVKDEDGKTQTARFSDNIYVVFSGGDDTFMVGAWDAVFEFAHCLHQNFKDFVAELKKQKQEIKGLPDDITLSAALVVVDPKFPVVRFAERAEEALVEAKRWEDAEGCRPKNRVSVFGQILEWGEFGESRKIGRHLADMIQSKDASRSIIERIKGVAYDYERLAERAADKQHSGPKVHRLFYTLRKWDSGAGKEYSLKSENEKFINEMANEFAAGLLTSFSQGRKVHYPKIPVAARWAEFLTRKQQGQ